MKNLYLIRAPQSILICSSDPCASTISPSPKHQIKSIKPIYAFKDVSICLKPSDRFCSGSGSARRSFSCYSVILSKLRLYVYLHLHPTLFYRHLCHCMCPLCLRGVSKGSRRVRGGFEDGSKLDPSRCFRP